MSNRLRAPIACAAHQDRRFEVRPIASEVMELCALADHAESPFWSQTLRTPYCPYGKVVMQIVDERVEVWTDGIHCKDDTLQRFLWAFRFDGSPVEPATTLMPTEFGSSERQKILSELRAIADERRKMDQLYPGEMLGDIVVMIDDLRREYRHTLVHFRFDYLLFCVAQSGSDWANHHIYSAEARVNAGRVESMTIEHAETVTIVDRDLDAYNRAAAQNRLRLRR